MSAAPRADLLLLVLAKAPLRGRSKTRLASTIGAPAAARLARAMLADTWRAVASLAAAHPGGTAGLALADPPAHYPLLAPAPVTLPQPDGDLGHRMARLLAGGLARADTVLLLGTDSPTLPASHVLAARAALDGHDLVLGPSDDGGFWCLGGRAGAAPLHHPGWLDGLHWDAPGTAAAVRARAAACGLGVADAPPFFDVDTAGDLPRLRAALRDPVPAPRTAAALAAEAAAGGSPWLSIVIPALDEGERLSAALDAAGQQPSPVEVLVADGGSRDGSAEAAAARDDAWVVRSGPGRGRQLAAGAEAATGELLLFLHADVRLPPRAADLVRAALSGGRHEAGAFVTRTVADPSLGNPWGPLLRAADLRSRLTSRPYGDQALFVTRAAYEQAGGFRPLPIMEDWDLSSRLAARAPLLRLRPPVTVSGRRLQRRPLRTALLLRLIPPLYRLGVDPERLARLYRGR